MGKEEIHIGGMSRLEILHHPTKILVGFKIHQKPVNAETANPDVCACVCISNAEENSDWPLLDQSDVASRWPNR